jgi:hypothetical protein
LALTDRLTPLDVLQRAMRLHTGGLPELERDDAAALLGALRPSGLRDLAASQWVQELVFFFSLLSLRYLPTHTLNL